MKFKMDPRKVPDGTILSVRLVYEGQTSERIWTYAMLKAGGAWYGTGTGQVPQAAGWGAVERWLADKGRRVLSIDVVTSLERIYEADEVLPTVRPLAPFATGAEMRDERQRADLG